MLKIYHNNRCSKSRCALDLLNESGQPFEIIDYLKNPPSEAELTELLKKLNRKPEEVIRKSEPLFKEKFADKSFSDAEWIKIMAENPILIERPIVVKDDKAVIGRPTESVENLLNNQ
jgi:arsenate reductase